MTGAFRYPEGDAGAKRIASLSSILKRSYNVHVVHWGFGDGSDYSGTDELNVRKDGFFSKLIHRLFLGFSFFKSKRPRFSTLSFIVLYNPPFMFGLTMLLLAKLYKVHVVLESNEWYESEHLPGGRYGLASIENLLRMRVLYPMFTNYIVMSDFMDDYYGRFGKNIIKIPPIARSQIKINKTSTNSNELVLLYAGSPGHKDRIDIILRSFISLSQENQSKVKIIFIGFTYADLLNSYPEFEKINCINDRVFFQGRQAEKHVIRTYASVDYVIFFRDAKRYALAGFPSKFVEALENNTPVITNPIGDIKKYLCKVGIPFDPLTDDFNELIDIAEAKKRTFSFPISDLIQSEFSFDIAADKLLVFFEAINENL